MKKVLAVLLAFAMILSFAACGNKEEEVEPTPENVVSNPQINLGENLPSFVLAGDYSKEELTEEQTAAGITEYYKALSDKASSLCVYRVPFNNATIMGRMSYEEYLYHYEEQQLLFAEFDTLIEPNDYHYGYYMSLREGENGEDPCYLQEYIFLDGEEFVKAEFIIPAYSVQLNEYGVQYWLPFEMERQELTDEDRDLGCLCKFSCEEELADTGVYRWDATGDLSTEAKKFSELYDVRAEYYYDYPSADGKTQKCVYMVYYETVDGVQYKDESIVTIVDGKVIEFNFMYPADEATGLKKEISAAPMIWSIEPIEAE